MRIPSRAHVVVRPIALFITLAAFTACVESQDPGQGSGGLGGGAGPGVNQLYFAAGSPSATTGGVDVGLTIKPTTGYTCTVVTIYIVDQNSNILASATIKNPGSTVTQSFTGLGNNVNVDIQVNSTFQSGAVFDNPYLEGNVTTK